MTPRSLGCHTDLLIARFDAQVVDRGGHIVVRTPSNPTFYWGNYLLFDRPPVRGDLHRWREAFAREIGGPPEVRHVALGWDGVDGRLGAVRPFVKTGYQLHELVVMAARRVHPPAKICEEAEVRPLAEDGEWAAAVECEVESREPHYTEEGYREYAGRQMARYRAMAAAGLGEWFGAFVGGRLVGSLGVFVFDGLGRFQAVGVHPDFRRRGVCGTMVHRAALFAFERLGADTLVIVTEAGHHAARIYESVGFAPIQRHAGLTWWEREGAR